MLARFRRLLVVATLTLSASTGALNAQTADAARLERLKAEALTRVDARAKQIQEIIDHQFSFSELGMQEFETQRYLTGLLEQAGFTVQRGYAGMPSA